MVLGKGTTNTRVVDPAIAEQVISTFNDLSPGIWQELHDRVLPALAANTKFTGCVLYAQEGELTIPRNVPAASSGMETNY